MYSKKYFLGEKDQTENESMLFRTGKNANLVLAVKEIVERYGDRKPIMISESGCGHIATKHGGNISEFALQKLKEQYNYLPMIYPQIKLIAYFDWHVPGVNEKYDYRLSTNSALLDEYIRLVKGKRFIQNGYKDDNGYCNRPIYNGIYLDSFFEVSCYAHMYDSDIQNVTYFIDDKYVGMSIDIPYTTFIDAREYSGTHKLKAVAKFSNGKTLTTESEVNIKNTHEHINVEIPGKTVVFD